MSSYGDMFRTRRFWSLELAGGSEAARRLQAAIAAGDELQTPVMMTWLSASGFKWIRRLNDRKFESIVRNPTIGCYVEVSVLQFPGSVPIDSREAKKMVCRLCYF